MSLLHLLEQQKTELNVLSSLLPLSNQDRELHTEAVLSVRGRQGSSRLPAMAEQEKQPILANLVTTYNAKRRNKRKRLKKRKEGQRDANRKLKQRQHSRPSQNSQIVEHFWHCWTNMAQMAILLYKNDDHRTLDNTEERGKPTNGKRRLEIVLFLSNLHLKIPKYFIYSQTELQKAARFSSTVWDIQHVFFNHYQNCHQFISLLVNWSFQLEMNKRHPVIFYCFGSHSASLDITTQRGGPFVPNVDTAAKKTRGRRRRGRRRRERRSRRWGGAGGKERRGD